MVTVPTWRGIPNLCVCVCNICTVAAAVIHQDDLPQQVRGRPAHCRVDGSQDHRQSLVDEDEDDADLRQAAVVGDVFAPDKEQK